MALDFRPVHESVGVEASGIDLAAGVSEAAFARLCEGVHRAGFVLLRGQELSPRAQMGLAHRLGHPLPPYRPEFSHPEFPELVLIGNIRRGGRPVAYLNTGGIEWHTDSPGSSRPPGVTMLYCEESTIPDGGGETLFASTVAGYAALPDELKARLRELRLVHSFNTFNDAAARYAGTNVAAQSGALRERNRDSIDAIVQAHPATGEAHIYVSPAMVKDVVGTGFDAGMAIVMEVVERMTRPELVYRHRWRPGDLVVFDNRSAIHTPVAYDFHGYPRTRRLLRQVIIGGRA